MRIVFRSPRFTPSDRIGSWSIFALAFVLSAFALPARTQTVGPITPSPSAQSQQAPAQRAAPTPEPDRDSKNGLAGIWKLNRDDSDDPRQKLEQASNGGGGGWGQGPSGGGGGWGRPGGWGGWGGPGTAGGGGWNRGGSPFPDDGALDMSDFSQLTIEQSDSTAKVTGSTGRVLARYAADNSGAKSDKNTSQKNKDNSSTPAAHWQGDELVTTVNGPRGTKTTRIYELSPNGKQLYVTTRLDNPRFNQPVNIRFVYDPARSSGN